MAAFNYVTLMGNMTRDPETTQVGDNAVCSFGIAVNRKFKTQAGEEREEVTFVDCVAWNRLGEVIQEYCQKGKLMLICGRLKYDSWEDKNGGGKRSKLSMVVETMQMVGGGRQDDGGGDGNDGGYGGGYEPPQQPQQRRQQRPPATQQSAQGRQNYQQQRQPAPDQRRGTQTRQQSSNPPQRQPMRQSAPQGPQQPFGPEDDMKFGESDVPF